MKRGALLMEEINRTADGNAGIYKAGLWSYRPEESTLAGLPPPTWGLYASVEHRLPGTRDDRPTVFVRVGWSPPRASAIPVGLQAGILVPAPFAARPNDLFSLGVASARLRGAGVETAYEATYLFAMSGHVSLQPDVQYVVHPSGILPSATVVTLRVHMEF